MENLIMSHQELDRLGIVQRVLDKRLTQREAARVMGLTDRQVRRLCRAYERDGPSGLVSKRRGRPSNRGLPKELRVQALSVVRGRYEGFGPTLAHEKLTERHGFELSVETLRAWMTEDGLWVPRAQREPRIQQPRRRRPCRGELVQIDGCEHDWFEDRAPRCTLLVFVDDASSELMELRFGESESAFSYFTAMRSYLETHGKPVALYGDKAAVFRVNRKEPRGGEGITQFGRAMSSLNIDIICANTPAAKGRVERAHLTLQDRLVKELKLENINDIGAANAFARQFIEDHNRRFARTPRSAHDAHRPLLPTDDLDRVFNWQETRRVSKSMTVSYKNVLYLFDPEGPARSARGKRIGVEEHEDGEVTFWHGEHQLTATAFPKDFATRQGEVVEHKRLGRVIEHIKDLQEQRIEERIKRKDTTKRDARLLHAGVPRHTASPPSKAPPR
ncbi:MAG: ISNCY family transposase [Actinomycetales bacterium]|nr:ISNCY family transposase [Actinomycetales bacterium]